MAQLVVQNLVPRLPVYNNTRVTLAVLCSVSEVVLRLQKNNQLNQREDTINLVRSCHYLISLTSFRYLNSFKAYTLLSIPGCLSESKHQEKIDLWTGAKIKTFDGVFPVKGKTSCTPIINKTISVLDYCAKALDLVAVPLAVSQWFQGRNTRLIAGGASALTLIALNILNFRLQKRQ